MKTSTGSVLKWMLLGTGLFLAFFSAGQEAAYPFEVQVTGKGQPVLLIPGLSSHASVWDSTVVKLSSNHECHALTLAGFAGQPAMDLSDGFLPVIRDEIIRYLRDHQLQDAILIGHSLGGFLSLDIARKEPRLVDRLVIVDSYPFFALLMNPMATEESMQSIAKGMVAGMKNQSKEAYAAQLKPMLASMITGEKGRAIAYEWGMQSDGATVAQAMYELYTTDLRQEIEAIQAPTLVMGAWIAYESFGTTRESTLVNLQNQYKNLEHVQFAVTDTGRHFIMWDDPEFYFAELLTFIQGEK